MLRLKVKIERVDGSKTINVIAIANSGFIGSKPEILLPDHIVRELKLHEIRTPQASIKISGDGREIPLIRYSEAVNVYVIEEDRVEGPVLSDVLSISGIKNILLNDKLLGKLGIVLLDFGEGTWCFRDELGVKKRSSA
ncbi:MAG: pepsin/retropepsin-like aspartic protease family protein [Candidatus Nezhaarchaeales archaeon]